MKIVFWGTPDFAIPSLKILHESKHEVAAVVTAPDKERGRGRKISFTPVKEYALQNDLSVLQPVDFRDENFIAQLKEIDADLFVVVAFRILPEEVFAIPKYGSFNLHGSLLPLYRGAAPIQWALINGDSETGVTTFFLQKKVDTGAMILQKKILIGDEDDLGSLHDKMCMLGADAVLETVQLIEEGKAEIIIQLDDEATPAPKITKEICEIDWGKSADEIHNLVRGLSPTPGAFFIHGDKQYKIYNSKINNELKLEPGEINQTKTGLTFGCGEAALDILDIKPEGRKRMTTEEFLRGYSLK